MTTVTQCITAGQLANLTHSFFDCFPIRTMTSLQNYAIFCINGTIRHNNDYDSDLSGCYFEHLTGT